MILTLDNEQVPLKSAVLFGELADGRPGSPLHYGEPLGIMWAIEVDPIEGDAFPRFVCDTIRLPVRRWTELSGSVIDFEAPYEYAQVPRAMSVISIWDDVPQATLHILERFGSQFRFRFEGTCFTDDELPFLIEGQISLRDINVRGTSGDTAQALAERLAAYIDVSELVQGSIEPSGPEHCSCAFKPKV